MIKSHAIFMTECNAINSKVLQHDRTNTGKTLKASYQLHFLLHKGLEVVQKRSFNQYSLHTPKIGKEH